MILPHAFLRHCTFGYWCYINFAGSFIKPSMFWGLPVLQLIPKGILGIEEIQVWGKMRRCTDLPNTERGLKLLDGSKGYFGSQHWTYLFLSVMEMALGQLLIFYLPNSEELCLSPVAVDFYCVLWQLNICEFYSLSVSQASLRE